jgi:Putative Flp pilus-assembly TadE/G-like
MARNEKKADRSGTVAVHLAVCLVAIMSVLAFSLDGGLLLAQRRQVQAAADAAALAAAADLYYHYFEYNGLDVGGSARKSALATAAANGYAHNDVDVKVTVRIPPTTGDYIGRYGYAEVIIEYKQSRAFSNFFDKGDIWVRARAVALGAPIAANVGILVLDPDDKSSFNAGGGGRIDVAGTPIIVNSNSYEAATVNGGTVVSAPEFDITGGYAEIGGSVFVGPIHTGQRPVEDPLAELPPPDPSTMLIQADKKIQYTSGVTTLSPGVYKGGISVSGTGSLILEPGIYYMDNGGFSFSGQGSLTGNGVLIYTNPGNGNSDGISVAGQGSVSISAMQTGPYAGITFWQDRTSSVTGTISGSSGTTSITGTFYFAGALLNVTGNGGVVNLGSQYISNNLNMGGSGTINIQWTPETVAKKRSITLVE